MSESKSCPKCGKKKQVEEFSKAFRRPDGLQPWCKDCTRAAAKAWYERGREPRRLAQVEAREGRFLAECQEWGKRINNMDRAMNWYRERIAEKKERLKKRWGEKWESHYIGPD